MHMDYGHNAAQQCQPKPPPYYDHSDIHNNKHGYTDDTTTAMTEINKHQLRKCKIRHT